MFTGLIEAVCPVSSVRRGVGGLVLAVDLGELAGQAKIGDSIAISGVCLTVSELANNVASFDVSGQTLAISNLGRLTPGSKVNVELAVRAGNRLGGHIVQGHIDGTATVQAIERHDQFANIRFFARGDLLSQMIIKGSVAVDGISLTVADMGDGSFSVALIPETLKRTTLGRAKIGDVVNIETDIIIKTIKKQLERILPQEERITVEKLRQLGF
jgi:riboflavin synthase